MINVTYICRAHSTSHILVYVLSIISFNPRNHLEKKSIAPGLQMRKWRPKETKWITYSQPRPETQASCLSFSPLLRRKEAHSAPSVNHTLLHSVQTLGHWHGVFKTSQKPEIGFSKFGVHTGFLKMCFQMQILGPDSQEFWFLESKRGSVNLKLNKALWCFWFQWFKDHTLRITELRELRMCSEGLWNTYHLCDLG